MAERERGGAECKIGVNTIDAIHRSNKSLRRKYPSIWQVVSSVTTMVKGRQRTGRRCKPL